MQKNKLKPIIGMEYDDKNIHCLIYAKNNDGLNEVFYFSSIINDIDNKFDSELFLEIINKRDGISNLIFVFLKNVNHEIIDILKQKNVVFYFSSNVDQNFGKPIDIKLCDSINNLSILKLIKNIKNNEKCNLANYTDFESINSEFIFGTEHEKIINNINLSISVIKHNEILNNSDEIHDKLVKLCFKGLNSRFVGVSIPSRYIERLEYELKILRTLEFSEYLLVVFDYVNFCLRNGIFVGPGRGSAAGSLACYCLHITQIDPLKIWFVIWKIFKFKKEKLTRYRYWCSRW